MSKSSTDSDELDLHPVELCFKSHSCGPRFYARKNWAGNETRFFFSSPAYSLVVGRIE